MKKINVPVRHELKF